jgi:hypothetical protein
MERYPGKEGKARSFVVEMGSSEAEGYLVEYQWPWAPIAEDHEIF